MGDYLEDYAAHFRFPIRTGVAIDSLRQDEGDCGYIISAGEVRYQAWHVIIASGYFRRPHQPDFAAELDPSIRQVHSSDYRSPSQLADGPVLVVGLSHSGADMAYEAAPGHNRTVSGKLHGQLLYSVDSRVGQIAWPVLKFLALNLLTLLTPIGRKMAREIRKGGAPLLRYRSKELREAGVELIEARTAGVYDGKPMLDDGTVLDVSNVIWCTGFRPDYSWIQLPVLDGDGFPQQDRGVAASAPGLYFLGVLFQYSFTSMLVVGAGRDAEYIVDRLSAPAGGAPVPA